MKIPCALLLAIIVSSTTAQPILTKNLNHDLGDYYEVEVCDTLGMSAGMHTGPNTTWNLTLNVTGNQTFSFIDRNLTNSGMQFTDANLTYKNQAMNWYTFYKKTATELREVAHELGGAASLVFATYPRDAVWPFTYNDSFYDTVACTLPKTNQNGIHYSSCIADGYGTLNVNGKTYTNVLRTFTTYQVVDLSNNNIEYTERTRWWDTAHKAPLIDIYGFTLGSSGAYTYWVHILKKETLGGIKELTNRYSNIAARTQNGQLYLKGELEAGKEYQMHLYNYAGQRIKSQTFTVTSGQFATAIPDMPSGVYFIQLQERGEAPGYIKFFHQ